MSINLLFLELRKFVQLYALTASQKTAVIFFSSKSSQSVFHREKPACGYRVYLFREFRPVVSKYHRKKQAQMSAKCRLYVRLSVLEVSNY